MREQGVDLVARFRALAPEREPIHIQRWSARRVVLTAATMWAASVTAALVWSNLHTFGLR